MRKIFTYSIILVAFVCLSLNVRLVGQSTPDIHSIDDIISCDFYVLPLIAGKDLDGSEAYFTQSFGEGSKFVPGDTIFESTQLYAFIRIGDITDEGCFYVQIYNDIQLGNDTTIIACNFHILPALSPNADIRSGYFTNPNGKGRFYSPGTTITSSISLYAYIESDNCIHQRIYQINIGQTTSLELNVTHFCPHMIIGEELIAHTPDDISPDSIWVTNTNGQVFNLRDTLIFSGNYTVFSNAAGCITSQEFLIDIVEGISPGPVEDFVVCGDTIRLPESDVPNGNRSYFVNEFRDFPVDNPYHHQITPRFGEIPFFAVTSLDKCRIIDEFSVTFLKTGESTTPLYQKICSGQLYPLTFMPTHPDIDFKVDEIVQAGENPYVYEGQFDTRSIPSGLYEFYLISLSDAMCSSPADTTLFTLEVVDQCTLNDTTFVLCENFNVAHYFPEILGGRIFNDDFQITSDNCCFFEYISEDELQVNNSGKQYYIIEDQFGFSDTSVIRVEGSDTSFELGLNGSTLCYKECVEITASIDREEATFMTVRGIIDSPFLRLLSLDKSPDHHFLTICFDPERSPDETEDYLRSDTLFVNTADTIFEIEVEMGARQCKYAIRSLSFETKGIPVNAINPLICDGESHTISGEMFDADRPSGLIILPGMAHDGCDSIIWVNARIDSSNIIRLNQYFNRDDTVYVSCEPYYSGKETDTLIIYRGPGECDSIVYIDFTFVTKELEVKIKIEQLSCSEDIILTAIPGSASEYLWYKDSTLISGADNSVLVIEKTSDLKEGDYYVFAATDTSSGYSNTISLELPSIHTMDSILLCHNEEYLLGDTLLRTPGYYQYIFVKNGCDSIVQLHLEYREEIKAKNTTGICPGEFLSWNGLEITNTGVYLDTLESRSGCDSLLELTVTTDSMPSKIIFHAICEGEVWEIAGDTISAPGEYEALIPSINDGCDTLLTVFLDVLEVPKGDTIQVELKEGQVFELLGMQYNEEGVFVYTLDTSEFCDTLYFIEILIFSTPDSISFYVPNIFSPNGDHINDTYELTLTNPDQVTIEELVIYNRWGSEVWRYNASLETSWDGKINNEIAAQDVYVVKIRLHSLNGRVETHFRDVLLLR